MGSVFSGIGGIDLGLERTGGFETHWFIEKDAHCQKVLTRHWPDVPIFGDIHEVEADDLPPVDMIAGGYPCQPFSVAGSRGGTDDPRHVWPEMRRLVRLLRPRYVLIENVPGHLSMGFGDVLSDLAALGFNAEWGVVSAADVGATHLRKRLFGVADSSSQRLSIRQGQPGDNAVQRTTAQRGGGDGNQGGWDAQPRLGLHPHGVAGRVGEARWPAPPGDEQHDWEPPRTCEGSPGRPAELKALGNAVVPQVAEWIGHLILDRATL